MKINTKVITELNPCVDRFENWKKHYGKKTYSVSNFLRLKKITHEDKLWVALRLAPRIVVETFAINCAMNSLDYDSDYKLTANCAANSINSDAYYYAYASNTSYYVGILSRKEDRLVEYETLLLQLEYLIRTYQENEK